MEGVLWYVLTGTRGGENRVRILRARRYWETVEKIMERVW